ncbi:MAG: glycosyltransferase family 39 protein, partial [Solirubrobacteraceae bacterium]
MTAQRVPALRMLATRWPALVLVVAAASLRLFHVATAYDIHVDEVSYTKLAGSVAAGDGVLLDDKPFFLHPPMFFWVLGGLIRILGSPGLLSEEILALRPLNIALSVITCAALIAMVERATTKKIGLVAGALFAVDAFAIRFDSRLFLETAAMTFTALAYLVLIKGGDRPVPGRARAITAGLLFGCATLTKDTALIVFAPALLAALATGRALPRRSAVLTLATAGAVYVVYLLSLLLAGDFAAFFSEKTSGFRRLTGADQPTGFDRANGPTLGDRLIANLSEFSASYAMIALGSIAALFIVSELWRTRGARADARLLLCFWQLSAVLYLAYAKLFGTLEEQMFYFLLIPSVTTICIAGMLLASEPRTARWVRPALVKPVLLAATVMILVSSLTAWYHVHTTTSNGYASAVDYFERELPAGTTVAVTEDVGQFLLPNVRLGVWTKPDDFRRQGVDYVLISTQLIAQGYGTATPALADYLARNATTAGRWRSSQDNFLVLYALEHPISSR